MGKCSSLFLLQVWQAACAALICVMHGLGLSKVLAVGDDVTAKYVSKGQIVVVGKYAGVELAKDKGVSIINVKDILGIVTE